MIVTLLFLNNFWNPIIDLFWNPIIDLFFNPSHWKMLLKSNKKASLVKIVTFMIESVLRKNEGVFRTQ